VKVKGTTIRKMAFLFSHAIHFSILKDIASWFQLPSRFWAHPTQRLDVQTENGQGITHSLVRFCMVTDVLTVPFCSAFLCQSFPCQIPLFFQRSRIPGIPWLKSLFFASATKSFSST
jgi:hypothetical protein